jgi:hypothetical protein
MKSAATTNQNSNLLCNHIQGSIGKFPDYYCCNCLGERWEGRPRSHFCKPIASVCHVTLRCGHALFLHKCFFDFMFHFFCDGWQNWTVCLHQILCEARYICYRNPWNALRGFWRTFFKLDSSFWMVWMKIWTHTTLLHHDNAPAHMSLKTTEFVTNNMVILPHPPYSMDLAPPKFTFFPKLKMKPKGWLFETVSNIQRESQVVLETDFHGAFELWKKWWDHCICSQGDYFEGDGSKNWVSSEAFLFWPSPRTFW